MFYSSAVEITYDVLQYLNYFFIALASAGTLFQVFYIVFSFMKPKRFKHTEKINKIAIIVSARNEEEVITGTVKAILDTQTYPKDSYDLYVIADNCTDNTAQNARKAGANVIIHNNPDPATHKVSFSLKYGIEQIFSQKKDYYDFFIRFDADNHPKSNFLEKMNDAFNAGIEIARPYEADINGTQNSWTKVSATYYMRDSRIASNFRERWHMDSMLTGAGMMVSAKILSEKGWDAMGMSEDAEYTLNRLLENKRVNYVAEAIVYEDQPSTPKDNWARLTRMGHGLNLLFWKKGLKLLGHFLKSGKWSNIDLFNQLLFIEISLIGCLWFPAYYIFFIFAHWVNCTGNNWMPFFSPADSYSQLIELVKLIFVVLAAFYVAYSLQTFLAVFLSKKDLGLKSLKGYWGGIFLSPIFMVFYGLAITIGVLSKPKWHKVNRNIPSIDKEE